MALSSNIRVKSPALDADRVYCTSASIKKVGRAVAVSLEDATLPGNAKNKHMTILYRGDKKWSKEEIRSIQLEATKWMVDNFGSEQAPVTFTITEWGQKSMAIQGDLHDLCVHLRERFAAMSSDGQRLPHVELFVGKEARQRKRGRDDGSKQCHICGGTDHFKKRCPLKDSERKKKGRRGDRKPQRMKKGKSMKSTKAHSAERARAKVTSIMTRIQRQKEAKQQEIALLEAQYNELVVLLSNVDVMDGETVKESLKNMARSFKMERKRLTASRKRLRKSKQRQRASETKGLRMMMAEMAKKEKEIRRMDKMAKKEERKRAKLEMKSKLRAARLRALPSAQRVGNGDDAEPTLFVHVDGYNLIGCDAECRKAIRSKRGGMKAARRRLVRLLQHEFMERADALGIGYRVRMTLWFDGKGRNEQCGDVEVAFSSTEQRIGQNVDDKLVEMLGGMKGGGCHLVVTSDRKLTVRLHDVGVLVMKSGVFYREYLSQKGGDKMHVDLGGGDGDDEEEVAVAAPGIGDEKEQEEEAVNEVMTGDFVAVINGKMECGQNDDEEESNETEDSGDYEMVPDEMEGGDHRYETPIAEEGEDSDFLEIFGDDQDDDDDDDDEDMELVE